MFLQRLITWLSATLIASTIHGSAAHPLQARSTATGVVPVLSGGQNPIGAGTWPRANRLADGSIIVAYTAFADGDSIITFARSTDQGVTWTQIGTAARGPTATTDIDNPYVLQLPTGRIVVAYRNHDRQDATTYSFFRITLSASDDDGATWTFLADAATDPGPVNGNWEPFLRNAADGSLQLYYSRENSADDQDSLMRTSTNGGATWSAATTISGGDSNNERDGIISVTTVNGPNVLAVFETRANGLFTVNSITSANDGVTWGNRRSVYTPTGADNNAGAPQITNVGGTLVAVFMTDEDTSLHNWSPVPQGADCKIITSGDGGQTWGNKLTVSQVESLWPSLMTLDDSNFLTLADHNGAASQAATLQ